MEFTTAAVIGVSVITVSLVVAVIVAILRNRHVKAIVESPLIAFSFESKDDDRLGRSS